MADSCTIALLPSVENGQMNEDGVCLQDLGTGVGAAGGGEQESTGPWILSGCCFVAPLLLAMRSPIRARPSALPTWAAAGVSSFLEAAA